MQHLKNSFSIGCPKTRLLKLEFFNENSIRNRWENIARMIAAAERGKDGIPWLFEYKPPNVW